jgi:hypothetical protein
MTETTTNFARPHRNPYFKANLRLWSDTEPLASVVRASPRQWKTVDVKGQTMPARGRVTARIAQQHYASSEDEKYENIEDIAYVLSQWLDEIEGGQPPISALANAGKIAALLWVAIFGRDQIATPALPAELDTRAKRAGVGILLENYTVMDEESGNPAKSFFGAKD